MITKAIKRRVIRRAAKLVQTKRMGVIDALATAAGLVLPEERGRGRPPHARYQAVINTVRAAGMPQSRKAAALIRIAAEL